MRQRSEDFPFRFQALNTYLLLCAGFNMVVFRIVESRTILKRPFINGGRNWKKFLGKTHIIKNSISLKHAIYIKYALCQRPFKRTWTTSTQPYYFQKAVSIPYLRNSCYLSLFYLKSLLKKLIWTLFLQENRYNFTSSVS